MKSFILKLKTLSPIFIGNGKVLDTVFGAHLFFNEMKVKIIDKKKLLDNCSFEELEDVIKLMDQNNYTKVSEQLKGKHIYVDEKELHTFGKIKKYEVRTIIKNRSKAYIPGSSFKGALKFEEKIENRGVDWLRVEDSSLTDMWYYGLIENVGQKRLNNNNTKNKVILIAELIKPGTELTIKISNRTKEDKNLIDKLNAVLKKHNDRIREDILQLQKLNKASQFKDINEFYSHVLNVDRDKLMLIGGYKGNMFYDVSKTENAKKAKGKLKRIYKGRNEKTSMNFAYYSGKWYPLGILKIEDIIDLD